MLFVKSCSECRENSLAISQVFKRRCLLIASALALTACGGGGGAAGGSGPVADTGSAVPAAATSHFDRLNEVRSQLGLIPLHWNSALANSSHAHAQYLEMNQTRGHEESSPLPGFTGANIADQAVAGGFNGQLVQQTIASNSANTSEAGRKSMDSLLLAPYHRMQLLAPDFDQAGVGIPQAGSVVVTDLGKSPDFRMQGKVVLFPFNGQTGVGSTFLPGSEVGTPATLPATTGTPLSVSAGIFSLLSYSAVSLRHADSGTEIPLIAPTSTDGKVSGLVFYPAQPLLPQTSYVWRVSVVVDSVKTDLVSRFVTGA